MTTTLTTPTAAAMLPKPNGEFDQLTESLHDGDRAVLHKVRAFMETQVAPVINDAFPFVLMSGFRDPQLRENDIVVPIEGARERVNFTVSSPLTVHNAPKIAARRAPEVGENAEFLQELGFSRDESAQFRTGGVISMPLKKSKF